jgi:hypothetical protein
MQLANQERVVSLPSDGLPFYRIPILERFDGSILVNLDRAHPASAQPTQEAQPPSYIVGYASIDPDNENNLLIRDADERGELRIPFSHLQQYENIIQTALSDPTRKLTITSSSGQLVNISLAHPDPELSDKVMEMRQQIVAVMNPHSR